MADEEDDDDADEHDRGVVSMFLSRVYLLALQAGQVYGPDEKCVQDDKAEERQTTDEDEVHPGMDNFYEKWIFTEIGGINAVDCLA